MNAKLNIFRNFTKKLLSLLIIALTSISYTYSDNLTSAGSNLNNLHNNLLKNSENPNNTELVKIPLQYNSDTGVYSVTVELSEYNRLVSLIFNSNNSNDSFDLSKIRSNLTKYDSMIGLLNKHNLYNEFTILICGHDNAIWFGKFPIQNKKKAPFVKTQKTELYLNNFFTTKLSGIEDHKGNPLVKYYPSNYADFVIDSKIGESIVLPNDIYDFIIDYIRDEYYKKNSSNSLSSQFWRENECQESIYINEKEFPDIKFTFPKLDNNFESITITLTPNSYITDLGCNAGFKKLSITHHDNFKKIDIKQEISEQDKTNLFIIGSPLFKNYGVSINLNDIPNVKFFENHIPCQIK